MRVTGARSTDPIPGDVRHVDERLAVLQLDAVLTDAVALCQDALPVNRQYEHKKMYSYRDCTCTS